MYHVTIHTKTSDSSWSAVPSNTLIQKLSNIDTMRYIATFKVNGEEHRIALGSPDGSTGMRLGLPEWFINATGVRDGEELIIHFQACEGMASAKKLQFKSIDTIPDWLDIRDVLEEPLSQMGVIKQGQILPVPVLDSVVLMLEVAEPADEFLFLDGEDIEIDVIADAYTGNENEKEEEEHATYEAKEEDDGQRESFSFLPSPIVATSPSLPTRGVIPFSGKGRTLATGQVVWNS
jgi:hypothetical protein